MINYDDFKKVEIRAGKIISAEKIPDTDKLLKLMVDFGEFEEVKKEPGSIEANVNAEVAVAPAKVAEEKIEAKAESDVSPIAPITLVEKISRPRQIVSGIALKFPDAASLVGKTCMFVTNLEPRKIKGYKSNGMLFAVSTPDGGFSLLEPNATIPPGTMAA